MVCQKSCAIVSSWGDLTPTSSHTRTHITSMQTTAISQTGPLGQKIQAYKNAQNPMMMNGQQRMSTMPQQGMMGMQMPMQMNGMQQPMMGQMGPMGMQMGMQQPGMMQQNPMMGMPMQMNGMGMQMPMQMNGMQMGGMQMPMGMNGMNMGMMQGGMMGPPMDPRQRDQIDRWMQGIRH